MTMKCAVCGCVGLTQNQVDVAAEIVGEGYDTMCESCARSIQKVAARCSSITIRKELESIGGEEIGRTGEGDSTCVLWRLTDGREVLETNGEPVWEGEIGFEEIAEKCGKKYIND